eukprot:COSAG01_NODE_12169_length_1786_cov_1.850118_2_plen_33_part_00
MGGSIAPSQHGHPFAVHKHHRYRSEASDEYGD